MYIHTILYITFLYIFLYKTGMYIHNMYKHSMYIHNMYKNMCFVHIFPPNIFLYIIRIPGIHIYIYNDVRTNWCIAIFLSQLLSPKFIFFLLGDF